MLDRVEMEVRKRSNLRSAKGQKKVKFKVS